MAEHQPRPDLVPDPNSRVVPITDFRGDPRRVVGHPSNPTNEARNAIVAAESAAEVQAPVNEVEDNDTTVPNAARSVKKLQGMYPTGILIPRSSGVEGGWLVSAHRQQEDGVDDNGDPIYKPLNPDEILVVSPDGRGTRRVKADFLLDPKYQEALGIKQAEEKERAARAAVASATGAGQPMLFAPPNPDSRIAGDAPLIAEASGPLADSDADRQLEEAGQKTPETPVDTEVVEAARRVLLENQITEVNDGSGISYSVDTTSSPASKDGEASADAVPANIPEPLADKSEAPMQEKTEDKKQDEIHRQLAIAQKVDAVVDAFGETHSKVYEDLTKMSDCVDEARKLLGSALESADYNRGLLPIKIRLDRSATTLGLLYQMSEPHEVRHIAQEVSTYLQESIFAWGHVENVFMDASSSRDNIFAGTARTKLMDMTGLLDEQMQVKEGEKRVSEVTRDMEEVVYYVNQDMIPNNSMLMREVPGVDFVTRANLAIQMLQELNENPRLLDGPGYMVQLVNGLNADIARLLQATEKSKDACRNTAGALANLAHRIDNRGREIRQASQQ
jgi:hypothetical protein